MAAFHLFLNEFKQSDPSEVQDSHSEIAINLVDSDYTKSLLYSLQANLQELKDEANNLKNASYRESILSTIQTYRSTEKILDYRKPQKEASSKNPPIKESRASERNASFSKVDIDFPCYGRGKDPQPDVDIGYMRKTGNSQFAGPLKKVIYEKNFEKYLAEKNSKKNCEAKNKTVMLEEPEIIQYLREEFLRMTRRSQGLLVKTEFVEELLKNQKLGELFGVDGLIDRVVVMAEVENIGINESINIDEFLHFYQISKNNLLKSRQVLMEEKAEKNKEKNLNIRLQLKYLLDKYYIENKNENSIQSFIEAVDSYLKPNVLEILQIPPILYESYEDFMKVLKNSEGELSIDLLYSLFIVPEVFDYILPEKILKEFQEVYNDLLVEEEPGVKTQDLIQALTENEIIQENILVVARSPQGLPSIPEETLDEILNRILKESPEWLTWEEFIRYFSIEGRPDEENPVTQTDKKPPLGFRYKITVPSPFTFSRREQIKQPSIRERRLKEMMEEDQTKIDKELENKFKAKPVPPEVKIPLFQQIMREQEERRLRLKEHFEAITKSLEKPFSFYYRDMARPELKPSEMKYEVFHANPVPWFCKVALLEKMTKQEELRKDRIEKIAREKYSQAKMPSRMEVAAKTLSEKTKTVEKTKKFPQFKAKDVPDFKTLQEKFAKSLASVKEAYVPQQPIPFNFHENRNKSQETLKLSERQADITKHWTATEKKRAASVFLKPKVMPATTQKFKDMTELKKKFLRQKEEDEEKKREEKKAREIKHEAMKRMMKKSSVVKKVKKNRAIEERLRERKEEAKRNEIEYNEKLQEIREKVSQRPFLIEQIASNSISRGFEGMEPMRRMLNQEYISEALTSQEQESSESFEE